MKRIHFDTALLAGVESHRVSRQKALLHVDDTVPACQVQRLSTTVLYVAVPVSNYMDYRL